MDRQIHCAGQPAFPYSQRKSLQALDMPITRVAFAGLSPLREDIVREALARAGDVEVVVPWTSLAALRPGGAPRDASEILFVELAGAGLPDALRAMLAGASRLRIVALSVDAASATVFEMREHRTVLMRCIADDLCSAIIAATDPAVHAPA
jgi:hypothetical protein